MEQGGNICRDLVCTLTPMQVDNITNASSKMTDVYEGSLIRMFRRLEELLRQMAQGAKVMGNTELEEKFEAALLKLKRDVVAAQSLYL